MFDQELANDLFHISSNIIEWFMSMSDFLESILLAEQKYD